MATICMQDEDAVDMEDFIDSGGLEKDTNTVEVADQQLSKVNTQMENLLIFETNCKAKHSLKVLRKIVF